MQKQTITIKTFFGEKTVNIDEFEKQWVNTINQLYGLTNNREDLDKCDQMKKWVGEMARADFERGLAKERGKDHVEN